MRGIDITLLFYSGQFVESCEQLQTFLHILLVVYLVSPKPFQKCWNTEKSICLLKITFHLATCCYTFWEQRKQKSSADLSTDLNVRNIFSIYLMVLNLTSHIHIHVCHCISVEAMFSYKSSTTRKTLPLLFSSCWMKPWQTSRKCRGETERIVPLRGRQWAGRARASGPGSAGLLLCSSYVCQGCIRFHIVRQGTSLGEHSGAGKWVSSQEVNNNSKQSSNKRGPSNVLTLKHIIYPCVQGIPMENI